MGRKTLNSVSQDERAKQISRSEVIYFNNYGLSLHTIKTDRQYSLATRLGDDLIRFWRSEIKDQGHTLVQVHVIVRAST